MGGWVGGPGHFTVSTGTGRSFDSRFSILVPGPRSKVPGPRSQVPGPRSQIRGPKSQVPSQSLDKNTTFKITVSRIFNSISVYIDIDLKLFIFYFEFFISHTDIEAIQQADSNWWAGFLLDKMSSLLYCRVGEIKKLELIVRMYEILMNPHGFQMLNQHSTAHFSN